MKKIGFIGLGNMGKGMSINLSKENLEIIGYDINDNAYRSLKNTKIAQMGSPGGVSKNNCFGHERASYPRYLYDIKTA